MHQTRGIQSPSLIGTQKKLKNMYDESEAHFLAQPIGPFETIQPSIEAAKNHFMSREIKLKEVRGSPLPQTSYAYDYPPRPLPLKEGDQESSAPVPFPFTSRSENMDQFFEKPLGVRPVTPQVFSPKSGPWINKETTNNATYKRFILPATEQTSTSRPATALPQGVTHFTTESRGQFTKKQAPAKAPVGPLAIRDPLPWLGGGTEYTNSYVPKPIMLRLVREEEQSKTGPFSGTTEYRAEYPKKEAYTSMPPLTGIKSLQGLSLPLPRRSLGVEYWHRGTPDHLFILLPRHVAAPCKASQIFTTLHDNQSTASIIILYGEDPVASNNIILGQFDLENIPPAPRDVPRILITYSLSKDLILTAEAHDLDTDRQKVWLQRGGIRVH